MERRLKEEDEERREIRGDLVGKAMRWPLMWAELHPLNPCPEVLTSGTLACDSVGAFHEVIKLG